jgi:lipopolysaccharide biosynthesis glycosyltransferase
MQDLISIVIVTDDEFMPMCSALVRSMQSHHSGNELLDIFLIQDGVSKRSHQRFLSSVNTDRTRFNFLQMKPIIRGKLEGIRSSLRFPINVYLRFFIPDFVPADRKRVLYIDSDIIFNRNVADLWQTDLRDNVIGAVVDRAATFDSSWAGIPNYRDLGFRPDTPYFNSGVLLIDVDKWRSMDATAKLIACCRDNREHLIFNDQYCINVVFAGKILALDNRWNYFATNPYDDFFAVHFVGYKPIYRKYDGDERFREIFFYYLDQTAWKNLRSSGWLKESAKKLFILSKKAIVHFLDMVKP